MMFTRITKPVSVTTCYLTIIIWTRIVVIFASIPGNRGFPISTLPNDCGSVPLYQKLYNRSINVTTATSDDAGDVRILYGLDAVSGEWPWIVRLSYCSSENDACMTCTGTLLSPRWVISAGHCGVQFLNKNFTATLGLYDLVTPDDTSFEVQFDKLVVHPHYKDLNNDLALFRLSEPVTFNDFVQPACLIGPIRDIQAYTKDKICYTIGYGLTNDMVGAIKLQKLEIQTKKLSDCNRDDLGSVQLRRGTVCIAPKGSNIGGSCKGDSGGPDVCYDTQRGGRWVLVSTVSYGPSDCDRDEDEKWVTVSVNLASFRTWILATIANNS